MSESIVGMKWVSDDDDDDDDDFALELDFFLKKKNTDAHRLKM